MKKLFLFLCIFSAFCQAKSVRVLYMNDNKVENVFVPIGKIVVMNFPATPTQVMRINEGPFGIVYAERDLGVTALKVDGNSNMFVYLEGRRFGFNLKAVASNGGDDIILVRDAEEKKLKVRVRE